MKLKAFLTCIILSGISCSDIPTETHQHLDGSIIITSYQTLSGRPDIYFIEDKQTGNCWVLAVTGRGSSIALAPGSCINREK